MSAKSEEIAAFERANAEFDAILHLVGQVVVAWGELDNSLIYLLAELAGCRPKSAGIIYYALDAFSTRFAVIKGLAQHKLKKGKRQRELIAFLARLHKLGTVRNDIIHAVYHLTYDPKPRSWRAEKAIFRSAREVFFKGTRAQTGELVTHLELLRDAAFWLFVNGWAHRSRMSVPQDLEAKIMALKTELAKSSRSH